MKTFSVIATLTILLPLAVALPTTSNNANAAVSPAMEEMLTAYILT